MENEPIQIKWNPISSDKDLPPEQKRYLFTIENANGRKVCLMNRRQIWANQRIVAWAEIPVPYQG